MEQYKIQHRKSTPYHPQGNGQVEPTNKVIESILTKTVKYASEVLLPIEFHIKTFRIVVQLGLDLSKAQQQRLLHLNELHEFRRDVVQQNILIQQQRKRWHDKSIQKKQFQRGDWVLLYDARFKIFKGKFHTHWMGPYEVIRVFKNGEVEVKTIDGQDSVFLVNGHRLKKYFQPLTRKDFTQQVQ
eukprot:PITA_22512